MLVKDCCCLWKTSSDNTVQGCDVAVRLIKHFSRPTQVIEPKLNKLNVVQGGVPARALRVQKHELKSTIFERYRKGRRVCELGMTIEVNSFKNHYSTVGRLGRKRHSHYLLLCISYLPFRARCSFDWVAIAVGQWRHPNHECFGAHSQISTMQRDARQDRFGWVDTHSIIRSIV
jgi:hypothetical protein